MAEYGGGPEDFAWYSGRIAPGARLEVWVDETRTNRVTQVMDAVTGEDFPDGVVVCDDIGRYRFDTVGIFQDLYISPVGSTRTYRVQRGDLGARVATLETTQATLSSGLGELGGQVAENTVAASTARQIAEEVRDSRGLPEGLAPLGEDGRVPSQYLPVAQVPGLYDVLVFGAVGDGDADDTAALQAALDAATAAGGGTVLLPVGTYRISARLAVGAHTTVWAYGATVTRTGGPLLANFTGSDSFTGYSGNGHVRVLGGTWAHNGTGHTSGSNALNFAHAEHITVRDVTVLDVYYAHAVELNACRNVLVEDCVFLGFVNPGSPDRSFSEAVQIDVAKSGSSSIPVDDGTHCDRITVRRCLTDANPATGAGAWGKLVGSHTVDGGLHSNITVTECTVVDALDHGIGMYGWTSAKVSGNRIGSAGQCGVYYEAVPGLGSADIQISHNTIDHSGSAGIWVVGDGANLTRLVSVHDNVLYEVNVGNSNAIRIDDCELASMHDNTAGVTAGTAFFAQRCPNAKVHGNFSENCGSNGINVSLSHGATVRGNTIKDSQSYGIVTSGATDVQITDNLLVGIGRNGTTPGAIRVSTAGTERTFISGNRVRRAASGTQTSRALSITSGMVGTVYTNNDFRGFGTQAATVEDSGTGSVAGTNYYA